MKWFLTIFLLSISTLSFGQFQKIFNQSIEIENEHRIDLFLNGEAKYEAWEGSFLLVETRVTLYNANENIFKAFVKDGRYLTNVEREETIIRLSSNPNLGHRIRTSAGDTNEDVVFKIYFPKKYKLMENNVLVDPEHPFVLTPKGNQ
ncbi:MAG: hypothetical protein KJP00_16005 [Bacteroidia bacterium]|nr:hypothetical protein [Bacteroidia bacterium]